MELTADVCIVGCGPAGALLGYLLAKNGISAIILEKTAGGKKEFRGEHILAETEQILKEHGLFGKIEEKGILKIKSIDYYLGAEKVKSIFPAEGEEHVGIHIPQDHLLQVLLAEGQKYEELTVMMNCAVYELLKKDERYVGVKATYEGKTVTVNSAIVVGADGRYSSVRKLAEIPVTTRKHGYDVLWSIIPAPKNWEATTKMILVNGRQLALFTRTGGFIQIGWNVAERSFAALKKTSLADFLAPLKTALPELTPILEEKIQSWQDFVPLDVVSSYCKTWTKDGLVLIGDAVHTMTPTAAFGINCAMKDAHVLAPLLTRALKEPAMSNRLLQIFESSRKEEVTKQQHLQIEKETSFHENFSSVPHC